MTGHTKTGMVIPLFKATTAAARSTRFTGRIVPTQSGLFLAVFQEPLSQ